MSADVQWSEWPDGVVFGPRSCGRSRYEEGAHCVDDDLSAARSWELADDGAEFRVL
jgi:hypothetical protein